MSKVSTRVENTPGGWWAEARWGLINEHCKFYGPFKLRWSAQVVAWFYHGTDRENIKK